MRVLELFSGTGEISRAFRERGHETITVDYNEDLEPDICKDIFDFTMYDLPVGWRPDVVWASPDCTCWSVAAMSHNWRGHDCPKRPKAYIAQMMVLKTLTLIDELSPSVWWIENPRGMLRGSFLMKNMPRRTITYCQYGDTAMKPTDIWTNCTNWVPKPMCHPRDDCHARSPRGGGPGTEKGATVDKKGSQLRAKIPYGLCLEVAEASETYEKMRTGQGELQGQSSIDQYVSP